MCNPSIVIGYSSTLLERVTNSKKDQPFHEWSFRDMNKTGAMVMQVLPSKVVFAKICRQLPTVFDQG
jgi:hypothetical protein